jgi:hypothetical protein
MGGMVLGFKTIICATRKHDGIVLNHTLAVLQSAFASQTKSF